MMRRDILVTGSSEGIGFETAAAFLRAGHRVAICARRAEALTRAAQRLGGAEATTGVLLSHAMDVTDEASVGAALAAFAADGFAPDILVNNAGLTGNGASFGPDLLAKLEASLRANLFATVRLCTALLPGMVAKGWGRVVNVASTAGLGAPLNTVPYATAKAAVIAFTRALANEVADKGVTVNAVAPGPVATASYRAQKGEAAMARRTRPIPSGRLANPADIASAIVFLCSDDAAHVTGQTLAIDGGEQAAGSYSAMWLDRRSP